MPQIYLSTRIEDGDSKEAIRKKLYLGIISIEEEQYRLGAMLSRLDREVEELKKIFREFRREK